MKLGFEDAVQQLKTHLKDYALSQGITINPNGSFRCPNKQGHKHGDKNPSGYLNVRDSPKWSCYKCKASGDIFDLASFLHELPLEGSGFKYETIPHVIEAINSDIEIDYGQEEIPSYIKLATETKELFKANPADYKTLMDGTYGPDRKYSEEIAKQLVEKYRLSQFPKPVFDHPVFTPTTFPGSLPLMIPITKHGFFLGAVGRHRETDVKESNAPKYQNSTKTDLANYPSIINYDRAINAARKLGRLNIFEGVFNTLLAALWMPNTIGILGVNSKLADLEELIQHSSVREVVFYLDKDGAGIDRAIELGKICHKLGVLPLFYKFNMDYKDYDIEFAEKGEALATELGKEVSLLSLIEFLLFSKGDFLARTDISRITKYEMIMEYISEYGSAVGAKNYADAVVQYYTSAGDHSIIFEDVFPRIRQCLTDKKSPLLSRINEISTNQLTQIMNAKTVEEKVSLARVYQQSVERSSETLTVGMKTSSKRELEKVFQDANTTGSRIYKTGYANIDNTPEEEGGFSLMQESLAGILGKPSHGKSLFIRGFLMHQALTNPDVLVLYFSTDDSAKRTLSWMTAGLAKVDFGQVIRPFSERDRAAKDHIQEAQDTLRKIIGETLIVYDKKTISTTDDIIRTIADAAREYPTKRIITATDNMYNANDIAQITNEGSKRFAIDAAIEKYKDVSINQADLVFNTLEVKKNIIGRLNDDAIKESGSINFRNDYTLSLFNSYKEWRTESRMTTTREGINTPILEVTVLKNKIGSSGKTFFFHLNGPCGLLEPVTDQDMINTYETLMLGDRGPNRGGQNGGGRGNGEGSMRPSGGMF